MARIILDAVCAIIQTIANAVREISAHPQSTGISPAGVCLVFFEALRESLGMAGG